MHKSEKLSTITNRRTARRFTTKTGEAVRPWSSVTVGRLSADALGRPNAFFSRSAATAAIAHDRRGHGRSSQPWNGNEMDTYADDLCGTRRRARLERGDPRGPLERAEAKLPVTSDGHGTQHVAKAVLIGAVPPLMLKKATNPGGLPIKVIRDQNPALGVPLPEPLRSFFKDLSAPLSMARTDREPKSRQGLREFVLGCKGCWPGSKEWLTASRPFSENGLH